MLGLLEYTQKPEVKPHVPDGLPPPRPINDLQWYR
jgi:hypothetical protein